MNSRMKEAIATVRYALGHGEARAARDEAYRALAYIEAELADAGPSLRERLARVEQDRQAYRRAHGIEVDPVRLMTPEQCEAAKARAIGAPDEAEATVARASTILGPYAVSCGLQQFKDALRHIGLDEVAECPHCGATNGEHKTHSRFVCMGGTYSRSAAKLDEEPLSPESTAALAAGLESARQGHIQGMGSFTQYVDEEEPAARCCVCGKPRGDVCGHDTDGAGGRRWYCSRECASK